MKTLKKLLYIIPLLGAMITSCTDVENIEVEHIGGYNTLGDSVILCYLTWPIRKQLRTTDVRLLSAGSQIGLLQV